MMGEDEVYIVAECDYEEEKSGSPVKKDDSTSYIGIRLVENGILYIRYRSSSWITTVEWCKTLIDKNS